MMLSRSHRIVTADDFRATTRAGRRVATSSAVVYLRRTDRSVEARFGFVVSKAVGGAVVRNLVRRRLKAIGAGVVAEVPRGTDIVIRALPAAAQADWISLSGDIVGAVRSGLARL